MLEIDPQTISNRERGVYKIDQEEMYAMRYLAERKKRRKPPGST